MRRLAWVACFAWMLASVGCSYFRRGDTASAPAPPDYATAPEDTYPPPEPYPAATEDPYAPSPYASAPAAAANPALVEDLKRRVDILARQVDTLQSDLDRTKLQLSRTNARLASIEAGDGGSSATVASRPPLEDSSVSDPTVPKATSFDPAKLLRDLRREVRPDETARIQKQIAALGDMVVPELIQGLQDPDFSFRLKAEKTLSQMDPNVVLPYLYDKLQNPDLCLRTLRILGAVGDTSSKPYVQRYLASDSEEIRYEAANALISMREKEGIPVLIQLLRSQEGTTCTLAWDSLKRATGESFGYKFYGTPEEREASARRWETWWRDNGSSFSFR